MKQEDKELLLKDLCARLPYGVKVDLSIGLATFHKSSFISIWVERWRDVSYCKPYLRPLSSMTEEEKEEYSNLQDEVLYSSGRLVTDNINDMVDWLNAHHFDYRRTKDGKTMIEAGLALEAPADMYNFK